MDKGSILIFGASGMLGRELLSACTARGLHIAGLGGRGRVDVTDDRAVRQAIATHQPDVIINAAAFTNVDDAELRPDEAMRVNGDGAGNVARAARESGALLVHYSTDYIFNGRKRRPSHESERPDPLNVYGRSKLEGERQILESGCDHLIIRTSWLFAPHGRNFVRTICEAAAANSTLQVVDDQYGRPTYAPDLADITVRLVEGEVQGIVNVANEGVCSRCEFARAIVEMSGIGCRIVPCPTSAQPRPAARPPWSVLDLSRLESLCGPPRYWREALRECTTRMRQESAA